MSDVDSILTSVNKSLKREAATAGDSVETGIRIPFGIFPLDLATGGGLAYNRINLIYGAESSMKTTLALKGIANHQKTFPDKKCVFVDVEGHYDPSWASRMGVDTAALKLIRPFYAEEAVDIVYGLMFAEDIGLIAVDSLAALLTEKEADDQSEKAQVGKTPLLINRFYRKTGAALQQGREHGCYPTLVLINQIRFQVGVMFGNPETMPGGPSFKFASALTLRVYGKDENVEKVSKELPAYKKVSFIIKKWKVPITSKAGEFLVALLPIPEFGLKVGDNYDWNTVLGLLKGHGMLQKSSSGWELVDPDTGEIKFSASTQDGIREQIESAPGNYSQTLRSGLIRAALKESVEAPIGG
jgi:recombination protein RecA